MAITRWVFDLDRDRQDGRRKLPFLVEVQQAGIFFTFVGIDGEPFASGNWPRWGPKYPVSPTRAREHRTLLVVKGGLFLR